jgi:(p)ppGpp synthase/HD superfamily hydrolase
MRTFAEAVAFAAERHADQRRKGARAEPYVNHVIEVARLLVAARPGDETLAVAGLLHDTVEDTGTALEEIRTRFGDEVAFVVAEVTDDKTLAREQRKRLLAETVGSKSERARLLKMADMTANLRSLQESPPAWDEERRLEYIAWNRAVAEGCRGLDESLEAWFEAAATAAERAPGERAETEAT